ncbi:hypothetical protein ACS0TY_019557 [Phlomoides rotata]
MTTPTKGATVLDRCGVAPPDAAGEVAEQRLPLTFFDMIWLYLLPIKRLLFYKHPCSTTHFRESIIPNLKNSLSETLLQYLPLAGNLLYPLDSGFPELRYLPGDSVTVTFSESSGTFDFSFMTGNQPRPADDFHDFVPNLPEPKIDSHSGFKLVPVLAIQVTLFPETGISVAVTNHHVVGDASSIVRFIKAWSSASKLGHSAENVIPPFYDRSVIIDPSGRRANSFWNHTKAFKFGSLRTLPSYFPTNRVRSTLVLQKQNIESLKDLVLAKTPGSIHLSSFTVTIAYVWSCFARSAEESGEEIDENDPEYFGFAVDARSRLDPPAPAAYFGNCIAFVVAESTHGRINAEDGFIAAAEIIGDLIRKKVNKEELLRDADEWFVKYGPLFGKRLYGVSGSPKFDLYDTDFGWGNPIKYEAISIDGELYSISLCKSREFEGGLEIGVSFPKKKMDAFLAVFSDGLKSEN